MSVDPLIQALRDRRHRRGIRPYILADLAGLSQQVVYASEAGLRSPRLAAVRAMADALDCDLVLVPRFTCVTNPTRERKAA